MLNVLSFSLYKVFAIAKKGLFFFFLRRFTRFHTFCEFSLFFRFAVRFSIDICKDLLCRLRPLCLPLRVEPVVPLLLQKRRLAQVRPWRLRLCNTDIYHRRDFDAGRFPHIEPKTYFQDKPRFERTSPLSREE